MPESGAAPDDVPPLPPDVSMPESGTAPDDLPPLPPDVSMPESSTAPDDLQPLPPVPPNVARLPMDRCGMGTKGRKIQLLTNHSKVIVENEDGYFFHYSVAFFYKDGRPVVVGKGVGRKLLDKVQDTYFEIFSGKEFAYDGEKSLFTFGALHMKKITCYVALEEDMTSSRNNGSCASPNETDFETDRKRMRYPYHSKEFNVVISYAAKIPMQAIASALRGQSENSQEAFRVLDTILRQHAAKQGCFLVRRSFFYIEERNFVDVGDGVLGFRGFHSSFRATQGGLTLNVDLSTTTIILPGEVMDFLIFNQNVQDASSVDWVKAKKTLKNLKVVTRPAKQEYKITGLSESNCGEQMFSLKQKTKGGNGEPQTVQVTVYDYFVNTHKIDLRYSADFPCINVGKPNRPTYFPIELCTLVSLQRYTKSLSTSQRAKLVEESRLIPRERMTVLSNALTRSNYDAEPLLRVCDVFIEPGFTQVEGRVLPAPELELGNGEKMFPCGGRWDFDHKGLFDPTNIGRWAVVNFSAYCGIPKLVTDMIKCAKKIGILMEPPVHIFEESVYFRQEPPLVRVEMMFEHLRSVLPTVPYFLLCLLPERKNCELYGPLKRKSLSEFGIVTQCIAPTRVEVNDQYLTNVLLKINAKLGGLNSKLTVERTLLLPGVSKKPTLILGMDVSHGCPGMSDIPSIAAVVSSMGWPSISRYRACVRTQSRNVEMIDSLFKRVSDTEDEGIMRELLLEFYMSSGGMKPDQIIIFRDGVSESQFNQVLNIELDQIIEACKFLDEKWEPKFLVIVAQKNHHTRFFAQGSPGNVPPGTIIDNEVCHPRNNDFYLCAHASMIGTTRPMHYHVLYDEVGFSVDDLQELVHSLSYVYQRSTTAISVVAPIRYAHLAAAKLGTWMKFEEAPETSLLHGGVTHPGAIPVPPMPKLHDRVRNSMFFC